MTSDYNDADAANSKEHKMVLIRQAVAKISQKHDTGNKMI